MPGGIYQIEKSRLRVSREEFDELLSNKSKIVSTSAGDIEYAEAGEGPVLISLHGSPGGWDQGLVMAMPFIKHGFKVIAPSRPGYLGTSAENGNNYESQADAVAALMDSLGIKKAGIMTASAGGPVGYTLANNHPGRVSALLPVSAICVKWTDDANLIQQALYMSGAGIALIGFITQRFPKLALSELYERASSLTPQEIKEQVNEVIKDPVRMNYFIAFIKTMSNIEKRKKGMEIDTFLMNNIKKLPMKNIQCPTLIIHGSADSDSNPDNAEYAASIIKNSRIHWIEKGTHLAFWLDEAAYDAQSRAINFMLTHSS